MMPSTQSPALARFGPYEVDVRSGEIWKFGVRIKLGEQPLRILLLLMHRSGELVTREELRASLWPDDIFVDFEHGLNSAVQRLREALSDTAEKAKWIETVPRRGYRFVGEVQWSNRNGSTPSPASIPAPLPLSPSEARVPETPTPAQAVSQPARQRFGGWVLAILSLALLLASLVIARFVPNPRSSKPALTIRSLAVLPLENLSGDPSQDFFADGMTDELITMLAKNPGLRVTSRTTVMQYKQARRPLPAIARELGVDGILEGSVVRSGNRVHLNVQLIYAPSDIHVWAESYDRDLSDVGSLQTELAQTIARQVGLTASGNGPPPVRVDPAAHDAYLLGRYYWFAGQYDMSEEYFQKAISLEPEYAVAWSGLADYYTGKAASAEAPSEQLVPQGVAAALKAVALDNSSSEAHRSLAAADYFGRWGWKAAETESARAIALNPQVAESHHLRSYILGTLNRTDEAVQEQKIAMEIDPFARPWALGYALVRPRHFDAAIAELKARSQAQPESVGVRQVLSTALWHEGREDEAAAEMESSYRLQGRTADAIAMHAAFRRGGFKAVTVWRLAEAKKMAATRYVSPMAFADCSAILHRTNDTLRYLELAYKERAAQMVRLPDDPDYDFLRSDPRFQAILQKMGLPPSQ